MNFHNLKAEMMLYCYTTITNTTMLLLSVSAVCVETL